MGKRTIAISLAEEIETTATVTDAALLEKKGDLTAILTSLEDREVLFLSNVHRLRPPVKEILFPALRDFRVDLVIGQGPGARIHPYQLKRFTCVSSVPRDSDLSPQLREAFALVLRLQPYSDAELSEIVLHVAEESQTTLERPAALWIAAAAHGSPHEAEALLRRMTRGGKGPITETEVREYFSILGVNVRQEGDLTAPLLDRLSGLDFEKVIGALLVRMGFEIEMTKASGDGGVDIIATLRQPFLEGRYLVQCKRFATGNAVGAPVVREFYGALRADHRAVKGIFITTSNFTDQARSFARDLPIELIDRERLQKLLGDHGFLTP
jgi:hypothetical protein